MKPRFYPLSLVAALILVMVPAPAHGSTTGNATVVDWTCIDNSYLPGGVSVVGKSYLIDTERYKNAAVARLEIKTSQSTISGKTKIIFESVKIETIRGSYQAFDFSAGIGHTGILGKSYPYIKKTYTQKLNLSFSSTSAKVKQISLSPRLVSTSKAPIDKVECVPTELFRRISMGKPQPGEKIISPAYAKLGDSCRLPADISFGAFGPLECVKNSWVSKDLASDTVASRAYRYLINRYNSMPVSAPNLLLRIDPEAGNWKSEVVGGIVAGAKLWGTSKEGDKPILGYISERGEYVTENLLLDGITENKEDGERNKAAAARGGGQAGSHGQYFDFIFSDVSSNGYGFYQVGAHEYTHFAQQVLSNNRTGAVEREFWIDEGCATFVGTGMGAVLNLPQNQRTELLVNLSRQKDKMPLKFFSRGSQSSYADPRINEVYDTGFLACEALVALKGIDAIESVYLELANSTSNYDIALKKVYGTDLDTILPILQRYITSVRAGKPLTLQQLEAAYNGAKS
ncbi:MAG: hypothetical protein F2531_04195 [Actinobacteria bacterium]|uniref:Unannotated protein n=1 Tax=freshwater metagenome TaxID=449393 RepID=A0A6J6C873_9ZZZZ|nr:hypothetical protein [Actinomycetota bacterium]